MKKIIMDNIVATITDSEFLKLKELQSKTMLEDLDKPSENRDMYNKFLHSLKLKYVAKNNSYTIKNRFDSLY